MKGTDHGPSTNKIFNAKRVQSGACGRGNLHHLLYPSGEPDGGNGKKHPTGKVETYTRR